MGTHELTGDARPGTGGELFLVEFSSSAAGEAEGMHAAFQHAVLRLGAEGSAIRWCAGWLVVAEQRCLCLVESSDRAVVVLARDTAALTVAPVHPVRPLPARQHPSPSSRAGSRS